MKAEDRDAFLKTEPVTASTAVRALWWQANGDWDRAHQLVPVSSDANNWVHGYLHRVEGDLGNAAYWYRLANRPVSEVSLQQEWQDLLTTLTAP